MRAFSVVLITALVLALAACTKDTQNSSSIQLVDPGHCTPVDVVAAPEVGSIVDDLASHFNDSPAAHPARDKCTVVRVQTIESATAARELVSGWKNTSTYGPAPAIWVPASSAWTALVNQRLAATGQPPVGTGGASLAQTPLVVAMPAPMAHALGWPEKKVGWADLAKLAADPHGWATHGHPEWGAFKLGKASPELNTSGLLATIATSDLSDTANAALESSVVYYGDSSTAFLGTWDRLDQNKQLPTSFASAVVTDERFVSAYNAGYPDGDRHGNAQPKPRVPLVAISPDDGAFESDYPLTRVTASWVDDAAGPGVAAFTAFARSPESQGKVVAEGFRVGGSADDVSMAAFAHANTDLMHWSKLRKKARVMLVVDESDSMGDAADWRNLPTPRMVLAKRALFTALNQFGPDDEVGLRVFSTNFKGGRSPFWADIVPMRAVHRKATSRAGERGA